MEEVWKEIEGYEGLYEVSNLGGVRSVEKIHNNRHFPSQPMAQHLNGRGYLRVSLNHPIYKKKSKMVHILVGKHHVHNPNNYKVLNHLKGNKIDNRSFMLEWTTHSGNVQHAYDTGLKKKGGDFHCARIVLNTQTGIYYLTINEAAQIHSINANTLYNKLSGKRTNNTPLIFA